MWNEWQKGWVQLDTVDTPQYGPNRNGTVTIWHSQIESIKCIDGNATASVSLKSGASYLVTDASARALVESITERYHLSVAEAFKPEEPPAPSPQQEIDAHRAMLKGAEASCAHGNHVYAYTAQGGNRVCINCFKEERKP